LLRKPAAGARRPSSRTQMDVAPAPEAAAAAPSTSEDGSLPPPPPMASQAAERRMNVTVDGNDFDLNALFSFAHLQDLIRQLIHQQHAHQRLIQGLRQDLETANRNGEATAKRLKDEIDTKATEKSVTALALETQRDKAAMEKRLENMESSMTKQFEKMDTRLETMQSKLYDVKVELETKAPQRVVDQLGQRVDQCATAVELADAKKGLGERIGELKDATEKRFDQNEAAIELNTKRILSVEAIQKKLATKEELMAMNEKLTEADATNAAEIGAVEARRAAALAEVKRELEIRHSKHEEAEAQHWQHIKSCEETVRTKADREQTQIAFDTVKSDMSSLDKRLTDEMSAFVKRTVDFQESTSSSIKRSEQRLDVVEEELLKKATLVETKELRELIALCSLRTEMRELLEALRQETTSRVRMLKERLDRTDRELLRQLEESQNNDRSDKFDALVAMVETKADKALTERWLEASQQLHGELQTVHVRTQTLGQGMKVVLGWVEGMADKVTGLQGAQHRMAQQVSQQREELQFGLNATARETISKVKGMLVQQEAPPPLPKGSFSGSKPLSRPTTASQRGDYAHGGNGPVVLKTPGSDGMMADGSPRVAGSPRRCLRAPSRAASR